MLLGIAGLGFLTAFLGILALTFAREERVWVAFFFLLLTIGSSVGVGWLAAKNEAANRYRWMSTEEFRRAWDNPRGWSFIVPGKTK